MVLSRAVVLALVVGCATASDPQRHPAVDGSIAGADAGIDAPPIDAPSPPSACEVALGQRGTGFEGGTDGWAHAVLDGASASGWPLDEWEHGAATSGPSSCHGGTKCWATRLGANYTSCQRAALTSPPIDLSACTGESVTLTFWSWHDFWTGTVSGKAGTWFDGGLVEVSANGSTWAQVTPSPAYPGTLAINPNISSFQCVSPNSFHVHGKPGLVGAGGSWQAISIALPAAVVTSTFRVRFAYSSGVSFASDDAEVDRGHTRPGWYLDDLAFSAH